MQLSLLFIEVCVTVCLCDVSIQLCCSCFVLQVDYVHVVQLTGDNFCAIVGLPTIVSDFSQLFRNGTATVYYDTTFSMGEFYVSSLLVFESKPVMPLLMLVHERRTTESHKLLFECFSKLTKVSSVVCVANREQAITNAVFKTFPSSTTAYCWNHIIGDVWVCWD